MENEWKMRRQGCGKRPCVSTVTRALSTVHQQDSQCLDLSTFQATSITKEYPSPGYNSDVMGESKLYSQETIGDRREVQLIS